MLYGRADYDRHLHAIDTLDALASAAIAGDGYLHRAEEQYLDIEEVLDFFEAPKQREILQRVGDVLQGKQIGGFSLKSHTAGCDMMRRKIKGKLMATISMLGEGDMKRTMKNRATPNQIKLRGFEFRTKYGFGSEAFVQSVLSHGQK